MKNALMKVVAILLFMSGFASHTFAQPASTLWETSIRYNCTTNLYEVYGRPTQSRPAVSYILASTVTVILPLGFPQLSDADISPVTNSFPRSLTNFNTRSPWLVTASTLGSNGYYVTFDNGSGGRFESTNTIVGGKQYLLFSFSLIGGCKTGLRTWGAGDEIIINSSDWKTTIVDQDNFEQFKGSYNNGGTFCTGIPDFGDLTNSWPVAKATNTTFCDANNDGIPDGTAGAVWAGNIIDGELNQNFSANSSLANGDDITGPGANDEDGFIAPAVASLNFGSSYDFSVLLKTNMTGGKQVYYGLWYDWNNNGSFTDDVDGNGNPAFYSGSAFANGATTVSVPVVVPQYNAGISINNYKVRLIVSDQPLTGGMYGATISNGEIEDYQAPVPISAVVACGNVTGLISSSITLSGATISWTAVAGAISYDVEYKTALSTTWTSAASATTATSLNLIGLSSATVYDWRVRNNCASGSSAFAADQFTTQTPCGNVTGLISSSITLNSATVSWTAVSGAISYDVEYKAASSGTWISAAAATTATTVNLAGLNAATVYDWRVRNNCASGSSAFAAAQFTTQTPCGNVTGLISSSITLNSATVSWTAVSGAISYDVEYKAASSGTWISAAAATTATSINLAGLSSSTVYDWRVRNNCASGSSAFAAAQFTTQTPCGNVTGLISSSITLNSATVSWTAVSGAISYDVEYKTASSGTWISAATATTSTSINLAGLSSSTVYDWRVRNNCASGSSAFAAAQFTTQTPCGNVTGLISSSITLNSATVSWTAVSGAISYDVEYKAASSGTWISAAAATTATTVNLAGLNAATVYDWRVRNNCASGSSAFAAAQFTTQTPCGNVTGLISSSITLNSATVSWTAVSGAISYDVEYKAASSGTWISAAAATTATSINLAGLSSSTVYDWRVRNNCASGSSAFAAAQFTTQTPCGNVTGLISSSITLNSATVSWTAVSGAISYDVEYKTASSGTWISAATATTSTSINLAGLSSSTVYDWRVRNNCASGSSAFAAAQFTTQTPCGNVTGLISSSITLNSATVSWTAVSGAISYDVEYKAASSGTWISAAAATTATTVNLAGLNAATVYDWRVRNNCASGSSAFAADQFTTQTPCGNVTGLISSSITLNSATVSWTAVSGAISYDVEYKAASSGTWISAAAATTATTVNLAGLNAATVYDWRVRNNCASGSSAFAAAQFTTQTPCGNVTGLISSSITLNSATVSWTAVSGAISYDVEYKAASSGTWISAATATTSTSINLAGLSSSTVYDWRVRNNCASGSSAFAAAQFTTQTPCGNVTGLISSSITLNSATVSWTAVSGAISYDVEYKTASSGTWISAATATTSTSINLAGLSSSTVYDWRVRNNCASGSSAFAAAQFTTQTPCGNVTGLISSSITLNSATVSWTAVSGAISYDVEYKTASSGTWTSAAAATTATTVNLAGLNAATVYDWRVRNNCASGSSAFAADQFTTQTPCGNVTGLISSSITLNSATVSWTAVSGAISYDVEYKAASSGTWISAAAATTATTVNLAGLNAATVYDWRVRNNCASGSSAFAAAQFTTQTPCGNVTGLISSSITLNSATVSWTAVSGAISYDVEYKAASSGTWISAATATTSTSINLAGLSSSTVYDWRVRNNCASGSSAFAASQFTTLTPCSVPAGLSSGSITLTSALISWGAVSGATNYTVEYKDNASSSWIVANAATTATSQSLSGLSSATLYDWRVKNNCPSGSSAYATAQFSTLAPCGVPTGLNTSNLALTSVSLNWSAVSGATNYTVEYKANSSATWIVLAAATTATAQNVSGLVQGTLYNWRVKNNCPTGTSAYATSQFTTLLPCGVPGTLTTTGITANNATLNWAVVPGATSYTVEYKLSSASVYIVASPANLTNSFTLNGLSASTQYNWRVRNNCPAGTSAYSSVISITTLAPCGLPTGLTSTPTISGATLKWTAVIGATNYTVDYKPNTSSVWITHVAATTTLTQTITGLPSGVLYDWRVKNNCPGSTTAITTAQFTTLIPCVETYEPNNSLAAAIPISVGTNVLSQIVTGSDKDYFAFNNTSSLNNIKVTLTTLPANYEIALYSPAGKSVKTSKNTGTSNELMIYNTTVVGTYKVYIYPNSTSIFNNTSCYTLNVTLSGATISSSPIGKGIGIDEDEDDITDNELPAARNTEEEPIAIKVGGLKVYPIPANNLLNISFNGTTKRKAEVTLIDLLGVAQLNKILDTKEGMNNYSLDVSKLNSGIYFMKINNGTSSEMKKVVIMH